MGHFKGYYEGVKKVEAHFKISQEMAHKLICPKTKIISQIFKISSTLVILCIYDTAELARTLSLIVDRFLFSQIFLGVRDHCAGDKVERKSLYAPFTPFTVCPALE